MKKSVSALFVLALIYIPIGVAFCIAGLVCALVGHFVTTILAWCFFPVGGAFIIAGFVCMFTYLGKRKRIRKIVANGYYVEARVNDISCNRMVRVNGINPYTIVADYKDASGNVHIFKSNSFSFNPESLLTSNIVKVYTNSGDYRHYYMDTDSILPPIQIH